jgi:hypothetical protein
MSVENTTGVVQLYRALVHRGDRHRGYGAERKELAVVTIRSGQPLGEVASFGRGQTANGPDRRAPER